LQENFDEQLTRIELRRLSNMQKMSVVLGRRLWESAGTPEVDTRRLMVSIGIAMGVTEEIRQQHDAWKEKGLRSVSPLAVQMYMPNAPAAAVGLEHHAKAGIISPVMADASGGAAISQAWRQVVLGEADVAICGGVEARIEPVPVASFAQAGMLSTNNDDPQGACRPFDKDRDGMVLGEGGALMLIETEEHAKARGAPILARLMGAAMTSDGYDSVEPNPDGVAAGEAIARAIELAGLTPSDIDHINAHATGTMLGDLAEARAIGRALGDHTPAVYAPKAALGHSMGGSGAVDAVLTVQALRDGIVPPTLNTKNVDPEIALDVVTGEARRADYRYAVSNSFGMSGYNIAVVFGAY
jgi:3-oxoacyl-[acyl-carrier-protein] synthase II/beta-ketoacyl ACP synthase